MSHFELPALPFDLDALAPAMSRETLEYHWGKHHRTYVANLNALAEGTPFAEKSLEEVVLTAPAGGLFNNAAQAWNHAFFWQCLSPQGGGRPEGALADAINAKWGSYDAFRDAFTASAAGNFGSGWTWLVKNADGSLDIVNTSNAATPITEGKTPLLTIDVWEHAYYIDHRNSRPAFAAAYFDKLVNWRHAEAQFAA